MKDVKTICKRLVMAAVTSRYLDLGSLDADDKRLPKLKELLWRFVKEEDLYSDEREVMHDIFDGSDCGMVYWQYETVPALLWTLGLTDKIADVIAENTLEYVATTLQEDGDKRSKEELIEFYKPQDTPQSQIESVATEFNISIEDASAFKMFADRILPLDDTSCIEDHDKFIDYLSQFNSLDELVAKCKMRSTKEIVEMYSKYFYYHWSCVDIQGEEKPENIMAYFVEQDAVMERRRALQWILSRDEDWFIMYLYT